MHVAHPISRLWKPTFRGRGFTFLELIVVMVIIAVSLAVAAPSLHGFADKRRADDAATQMLMLIRWAQSRAVIEARPYRFNLDTKLREYYLTAQEGGVFVAVPDEFGRTFTLPVGVTANWLQPQRDAVVGHVEIRPNGTVEPGRLHIAGSRGAAFELGSESAAKQYVLQAVAEER